MSSQINNTEHAAGSSVGAFRTVVGESARTLGLEYELLVVRPAGAPALPTAEDAWKAEELLAAFVVTSEDPNELEATINLLKGSVRSMRAGRSS